MGGCNGWPTLRLASERLWSCGGLPAGPARLLVGPAHSIPCCAFVTSVVTSVVTSAVWRRFAGSGCYCVCCSADSWGPNACGAAWVCVGTPGFELRWCHKRAHGSKLQHCRQGTCRGLGCSCRRRHMCLATSGLLLLPLLCIRIAVMLLCYLKVGQVIVSSTGGVNAYALTVGLLVASMPGCRQNPCGQDHPVCGCRTAPSHSCRAHRGPQLASLPRRSSCVCVCVCV